MLRFLTAGESHGKALVTILEGVPAGLTIDLDIITAELRRRQTGYGRGRRIASPPLHPVGEKPFESQMFRHNEGFKSGTADGRGG